MRLYDIERQQDSSLAVLDNGQIVGYLSPQHEEQGLDIKLDLEGYTIVTLCELE